MNVYIHRTLTQSTLEIYECKIITVIKIIQSQVISGQNTDLEFT